MDSSPFLPLVRRTLLQSARQSGQSPRALSLCAALQAIAGSWQVLAVNRDELNVRLVKAELDNLAKCTIGDRPSRVEPRAVKRRPKPHRLLTKPRAQARAELLEAASS